MSFVLSFDVQWKHVILGFYFEQNSKLCFLNSVTSFLAFKIFIIQNLLKITKQGKTRVYVSYVKNNLINNCAVLLKFLNTMYKIEKLERLAEMLYFFSVITLIVLLMINLLLY